MDFGVAAEVPAEETLHPSDLFANVNAKSQYEQHISALANVASGFLGKYPVETPLVDGADPGLSVLGYMIQEDTFRVSLQEQLKQPPNDIGLSSLAGGYDFVIPLEDRHRCPKCLLVLQEPVQAECGHRFCHVCLELIRRGRQPRCPLDDEPLGKVFPDNFCKHEVLALPVRCVNRNGGCGWTGKFRELQVHLDSCLYSLVPCPHWNRGCEAWIVRARRQHHVCTECDYGDTVCAYCKVQLPQNKLEMHVQDDCRQVDVLCINKCGKTVKLIKMADHIKLTHVSVTHKCDVFSVSCRSQDEHPSPLAHTQRSEQYHLTLAIGQTSALEEQAPKEKGKGGNLGDKQRTVAYLSERHDGFDRGFRNKFSKATEEEHTSEKDSHLEEQLEITEQPDGDAPQEQHGESVFHFSTAILQTDAILAQFDLRLLSQETISVGGVLLWKIPDLKRHYKEARTGLKPSLISPPFYTGCPGFKLCAQVYLYGDGVGKKTHLSVFFVVMRGDFDTSLPWPFHQKVTLTLVDQSPARHDHSEVIRPDLSSPSFQRPTSEMNIASGCPRFVSLDVLRNVSGYVKDNSIFLRIAVDCHGLTTH